MTKDKRIVSVSTFVDGKGSLKYLCGRIVIPQLGSDDSSKDWLAMFACGYKEGLVVEVHHMCATVCPHVCLTHVENHTEFPSSQGQSSAMNQTSWATIPNYYSPTKSILVRLYLLRDFSLESRESWVIKLPHAMWVSKRNLLAFRKSQVGPKMLLPCVHTLNKTMLTAPHGTMSSVRMEWR